MTNAEHPRRRARLVVLCAALALNMYSPADLFAEPPTGEWRHSDLRGVEVLPGGTCVRVWFEERTYSLQPSPPGRATGAYRNVVRAMPASPTSFAPTCAFPAPAENPIAHQIRMWLVVATDDGAQGWRVRAQPAPGGGDFDTLKTEEFTTRLVQKGDMLLDGPGDERDADRTLVFRRDPMPPAAARAELERLVRRLEGGGCLEVISRLVGKTEGVSEVCALRRQIAELQGPLVSIAVDVDTPIDRVPSGFPDRASSGWRRQRGAVVSFTAQYERAKVPGSALLFDEEGQWRVVVLWF